MRPWHVLAEIRPYDPVVASRVPVRVASANLRGITGLGGQVWEPAMMQAPATSIVLFGGDFSQAVARGSARLPLNLTRLRRSHPHCDDAHWAGAEVVLYIGRDGDPWPWRKHFAGRVKTFGRERDVLALACEVDEEPFQAEVLKRSYAGTGDGEGGADLKDRPKPLTIGWAQNVEPVLINAVDSVYQFSGYGAVEAVDALYERASDFGAETGDHADYAALVAASIPAGRWATCLAEGLVRLGAPAAGVITGDVRGHAVDGVTPRLPGAMVQALADIAEVDPDLIDDAALAAMDAAAAALPDQGRTNLFLSDQTRLVEAARRLALPLNHQCGVSLTGVLFVTAIGIDPSTSSGRAGLVLHAQGRRLPQVIETREMPVSPPYAAVMLGANRCWRVHSMDEIAFDGPLTPRGSYDNAATYRYGDIVSSPDQSEWIYINDVPASGNAPPAWPTTSNAHWSNIKGPVGADDIAYSTGDTLEDMMPAEPAADVTSGIPTVPETVIQCDYAGAAKAGQLPRVVQFTLLRNGADVTDQATWAVATIAGTITAAISNTAGSEGKLTITAITTDALIEIEADYGSGTAVRVVEHRVRRQLDGAPVGGGGGSGDSGAINGSASTNTLVAIGDELVATVGASGDVDLFAQYNFSTDQVGGSQHAYTRWYKWNGSAYVAIGAETISDSPYNYVASQDGEGGHSHSDTGNTPAAVETYRLYGRSATAGHQTGFSGSCSAVTS